MHNQQKKLLLKSFGIIIGLFLVYLIIYLLMDLNLKNKSISGVTFSRIYTQELNLNPDDVLTATLDDLNVRYFRIPAYWTLIEPQKGEFDWEWLDHDLQEIKKRDGKVILAVGFKLPRWPECWFPDWIQHLTGTQRKKESLRFLKQVVERYQNHSEIIAWQVENEANFKYGYDCPEPDSEFYTKELNLVKQLKTNKPIYTTDSGELSRWSIGQKVDRLGVSIYRIVISPLGIFSYGFLPPQFYLRKAQLLKFLFKIAPVYISEFQMEPWTVKDIIQTPLEEQARTFNIQQMKKNITFAKKSGFAEIYYWGVEWWYWMKVVKHHPEYWALAKTLFK